MKKCIVVIVSVPLIGMLSLSLLGQSKPEIGKVDKLPAVTGVATAKMPPEIFAQLKSVLERLDGASAVVNAATKVRDDINVQVGTILSPWCSMAGVSDIKDCKISPDGTVVNAKQADPKPK